MKLYQDYTKKPYSYLVNDIIRKSITIHEELILKKSISENDKAIDKKILENKAQYDFSKQNTKVSALYTANVNKYEFLTDKYVFYQKTTC